MYCILCVCPVFFFFLTNSRINDLIYDLFTPMMLFGDWKLKKDGMKF